MRVYPFHYELPCRNKRTKFESFERNYSSFWQNFLYLLAKDTERREGVELINLHNSNDYYAPMVRSCDSRPLVYFPKIWNDFLNPLRAIAHKNTSKKKLKQYFLDKLAHNYQCDYLLCPQCHLWIWLKPFAIERHGFGSMLWSMWGMFPLHVLGCVCPLPSHATPWAVCYSHSCNPLVCAILRFTGTLSTINPFRYDI
jgi:hypothetical protein